MQFNYEQNIYSKQEKPISENKAEKEPIYRLAITRHADRMPDGNLTPEGKAKSKEKGIFLGDSAEVVKGYSSDEKTNRTYETSELISRASGTIANTSEYYKTRKVTDIQYEILKPDLAIHLKKAAELIDQATLEELGYSTQKDENGKFLMDLTKLPEEEQIKFGPIRAKNQIYGFRYLLGVPQATERMAMGLAHRITKGLAVAARYDQMRKYKDEKLEKDAVLNTVTHGMFIESLLKEAGVMKNEHGEYVRIKDIESREFGGFIEPAETIYIQVGDPGNLSEYIPVIFEGQNRPKEGRIFISKENLYLLAENYKKFKEVK